MLSETLTILLVEDSSTDTCLVQERLGDVEAFQFQLIHVSRLAEALACLTAQKSISVILLDLSLPDAQGLDAVTQVLLVSPDIPIVVMSSLSDEAIRASSLTKRRSGLPRQSSYRRSPLGTLNALCDRTAANAAAIATSED
jgi:CheY-like chemotaxis protein